MAPSLNFSPVLACELAGSSLQILPGSTPVDIHLFLLTWLGKSTRMWVLEDVHFEGGNHWLGH